MLSEHVTYWNHLGWSDPFSFDAMTERQEQYARHFGLDSNYTPQMVVDGTEQFVGSDGRALVAALTKQAKAPKVPADRLLNGLLRDAGEHRGAVWLTRLAEHVARTVDDRIGLDAQAANWRVDGDDLACLDVSTPLMREAAHRAQELDLEPFLSIYPWGLRPALARVAQAVMAQYHDPRTVLLDVASNLVKEELDRWLPTFLAAVNARVQPAITEAEARRYFVRDRRLWLLMQRLRRADRAWQRRVRRRVYPFLLAPPYRYGPHRLPETKAA